jgi:hypothetical protein
VWRTFFRRYPLGDCVAMAIDDVDQSGLADGHVPQVARCVLNQMASGSVGSPAFPSGDAFGSDGLYYSSTMYELQP